MVSSPQDFASTAAQASREMLPLYLWITFHIGRNKDLSCFGFTQGLAALGHKELEVAATSYAPDDVLDRLFNIAHYVIDGIAVLKDGQTIGMSAMEKIRVEFRPSQFGQDGRVMRLTFPK